MGSIAATKVDPKRLMGPITLLADKSQMAEAMALEVNRTRITGPPQRAAKILSLAPDWRRHRFDGAR